jgi:hypothetical protein
VRRTIERQEKSTKHESFSLCHGARSVLRAADHRHGSEAADLGNDETAARVTPASRMANLDAHVVKWLLPRKLSRLATTSHDAASAARVARASTSSDGISPGPWCDRLSAKRAPRVSSACRSAVAS